jgi:starch-binding outer membrane protein, SusD/RagB family
MKIIKRILISIAVVALFSVNACTDLSETIYSDIASSNFYNNKTEVTTAVLRPYTHARAWAGFPGQQEGYWHIQELSADQLAWPQKGRHGYDQGKWIHLHRHTWDNLHNTPWNAWRLMFWGMGFTNNTLQDFETLDFDAIGISEQEKNAFIAELKVLRAWHYLSLMELFGNIPVVTTVGTPLSPETLPVEEVFAFVERELLENVDNLAPKTIALAGRVSRAAGYAMLSHLYLNAESWTGTAMWDKCIAATDKILSGETGSFELDPNVLVTYSNTNEKDSKEIIYDLAYNRQIGGSSFTVDMLSHYVDRQVLDVEYGAWNGIVTQPQAFDAYQDNDIRKQEWFRIGPQFVFGTDTPVLGTEEYAGEHLIFVNEIRRASEGKTESTMTDGEENSGARFYKYRTGRQSDPNYRSNNYIIYRLTEMYFNKAEAMMRKNGNVATAEVVDLVNAVRERAFAPEDWATEAYTTSTLTMDEFLAERGREFYAEGKRRTDLIRFNKFTESWWDKQTSPAHVKWMPIPYNAMSANPALEQNPGY